MKKLLLLSVLIILSYFKMSAQEVSAERVIDTNDVLIGDWINISLMVKSNPPADVIWPAIPDSIDGLEVIARSKIDTQLIKGSRILKGVLTVTAFDSGRYEFPQITFMYKRKGFDQLFSASTSPVTLNFATVVVDTTKPIRDIKGPLEVEFSLLDYILEIIIGLSIIILAIIIYLYIKRRKQKPVLQADYDPDIPAHIIALEALRQLNEEKLWQQDKVKLYHSKLTDIVRVYILRRFGLNAPDLTTAETVQSLGKYIPTELLEKTRATLELADLVKFAKVKPLPNENALSYEHSVDFVRATIPANKSESVSNNNGGENV